jgi:hypothetical protein
MLIVLLKLGVCCDHAFPETPRTTLKFPTSVPGNPTRATGSSGGCYGRTLIGHLRRGRRRSPFGLVESVPVASRSVLAIAFYCRQLPILVGKIATSIGD